MPIVTIGLPVYNGEKFLPRALDSLLAQTFEDFELIICDNASRDGTSEICAAYAARDGRIRVYRNDENLGAAKNYNLAVKLAQGEFFKWATHDDIHSPLSLELAVRAMQKYPDASVCVSAVSIVDEKGLELDRWTPSADLASPLPHVRLHRLIWSMGEPHPTYGLHRKAILEQTSLMQGYVGSDRTLLAQIAILGPIVPLTEVLHFFTIDSRRPPRKLSTYTNPKNERQLPLRTWRVLIGHIDVALRSPAKRGHKVVVIGSIIGRFGIRDFRRLVAETIYSLRIVILRRISRAN